MDLEQVKETDIWSLYQQGRTYLNILNVYSDTDKNYRMYNGDQWDGLNIKGIEKIQLNFIKPVVKYKTGMVLTNLYAVNYSSENFENKDFRKQAEKICKLLNKKSNKIWEHDYMDLKLRAVVKDSAINDEGLIYVNYDKINKSPVNEIINKVDILYGNENDSDIQNQPYIIVKQRKSVIETKNIAKANGVSDEEIQLILGDNDSTDSAGDSSKYEKDDMCTLLTKMYKENGKVYYEQAVKYVDIKKKTNSGMKYYPVAHMLWEDKKGSARGEGEVRFLIPNQIEVNRTAMRRAIAIKNTAYPQKVVAIDKVQNPSSINEVGGIVKIKGQTVEDVNKIFGHINPAQMSTDVEKLQNELISATRELAGAGEIATGEINPEDASGKAILAVQQASNMPLSEHIANLKGFVEDLARIWLDMITVYNKDGIELEDIETDPNTGEEIVNIIKVPQESLIELQASVKVDITPRGAFDKYAQEMSVENLLKNGYFSQQKLGELKTYVRLLDDDSVMPKQKLEEAIKYMEEEQRKIAEIQAQAQLMQQRANQFINGDINEQASMINDAQQQIQAQ